MNTFTAAAYSILAHKGTTTEHRAILTGYTAPISMEMIRSKALECCFQQFPTKDGWHSHTARFACFNANEFGDEVNAAQV